MSKKFSLIIIILALVIAGGFFYKNYFKPGAGLSPQKAGEKAIAFINENMLQGVSASLINVKEESEIYKVHFKIQEQEHDAFVSKDGKFLFTSAINLEKAPQVSGEQTEKKAKCEDFSKTDQSLLEVFVVSKCPFGIQMQRILGEIVKNIPSLKENIKVKYLGSVENNKVTSMHGDEEAEENLRQICIREEQQEKYWDYVGCHIKKGEVEGCLKETGVDGKKLEGCLKGKGLDYAKKDFEDQDKYQIGGSPGLVLNGEEVDEQGFSKAEELVMRSAEMVKGLICCGFNQKPEVCSQELTKEPAATSFSETYSASSSSSSGSCQ